MFSTALPFITRYAQPALFAVSYALGAALLELGVEPTFLTGHSVGEFAAAVLAEVLTLDEAARLVVSRGQLMQQLPAGGAMRRRRRPRRRRRRPCGGGTVVWYRRRERAAVDGRVRSRRSCRPHHPRCCPRCQDHLARCVTRVPFAAHGAGAGGVPRHRRRRYTPQSKDPALVSTLHGGVVDGTDMDADYWAAQVTSTVRFADAIATATMQAAPTHLVELGPRSTLLGLARRCVSAHPSAPWRRAAGRTTTARVSRGSPHSYTPTG